MSHALSKRDPSTEIVLTQKLIEKYITIFIPLRKFTKWLHTSDQEIKYKYLPTAHAINTKGQLLFLLPITLLPLAKHYSAKSAAEISIGMHSREARRRLQCCCG